MTAPIAAPFGLLASGYASYSYEQTRDDMRSTIMGWQSDIRENDNYYSGMHRPEALGIAVPPEMKKLLGKVGYPRLFVDSLSERMTIQGFRLGGADQADDVLWDWWQANNLDAEAVLAHSEALIHGRSYITISAPGPYDTPGIPIICVESSRNLYAQIDPRTRQTTQAIRVIHGREGFMTGQPIAYTLYLPNVTVYWNLNEQRDWVETINEHNLGVVPVVPLRNRTTLSDLHGTTQITPELKAVTDAACRIMMDMQGAAELMAVPQRLLFGVSPEDLGIDPASGQSGFDAYMSRMLAFADPEGKAFQFAAAELDNFSNALAELDRKAAQITGLPPQYVSMNSETPTSAEAIRASESRLVKMCETKNIIFGSAWEQVMRIAYAIVNGSYASLPEEYFRMETLWDDPSTPTYAAKADAATKLYGGGIGVIPRERARIDMGYTAVEREEMNQWDTEDASRLMAAMPLMQGLSGGGQNSQQGASTAGDPDAKETTA